MKQAQKIISVILAITIVLSTFILSTVQSYAVANELGDTNSDGSVNGFDALAVLRYITGVEELSNSEITAADVDNDGKVTTSDALYILQLYVGLIGSLPGSTGTEKVQIIGGYSYDPASGNVTDSTGKGFLGFSYDANENVFYASMNAWQRQFGYTELYDKAAPLGYIWYDTSRIFFNYNGNDYMMQLWKGRYGAVLVGCEIGLYYRDENDTTLTDNKGRKYYKCADDELLIKMSLSLYKGNELKFARHQQYAWWLTGFKLILNPLSDEFNPLWGKNPEDTASLKICSNITFTDADMMNAFIEGLKNTTTIEHNVSGKTRTIEFKKNSNYYVNPSSNSVTIEWE